MSIKISDRVAVQKSVDKNKFWVHYVDIKNTTESNDASENRIPDPTLTTFSSNGSVSQINDDVCMSNML